MITTKLTLKVTEAQAVTGQGNNPDASDLIDAAGWLKLQNERRGSVVFSIPDLGGSEDFTFEIRKPSEFDAAGDAVHREVVDGSTVFPINVEFRDCPYKALRFFVTAIGGGSPAVNAEVTL